MHSDTTDSNKDFFIDKNGLFVMTASFHKKRGYCCGNKCMHCPYSKPSKKGNTELEKGQ